MVRSCDVLAAVLALAVSFISPADGGTVIRGNEGGSVAKFAHWAAHTSGPIMVDGPCNSACTMILARRDLCATERASFGFHQAYDITYFGVRPNDYGTDLMWRHWPVGVRNWIRSQGGVPMGPFIVLRGEDLHRLIRPC